MKENHLAYRQVHLDFHTSEAIAGIGSRFSREQFQKALKLGHVNSITVFSKCHHGWAYHPSKANEMHPGLNFDLLGEMIEAAHEIGVKTPVYISAGLDEKTAVKHPEWLIRKKNSQTQWASDFLVPGYHEFCMNSPYLDYLAKQVEEVVENYNADGIFLDIVGVRQCYCNRCIASIRAQGKDPRDPAAVLEQGEKNYALYTKTINETIHRIKPGMRIFHNGGHIRRGRRDLAFMNTHLELESLPTGGWGYDHFPLSARYVQNLGMEFLGMTGKFHTSWGEFGGFKHPNALRYEAALSIANGAKCSIGDQLHPEGLMDEFTYALIGAAYAEVEAKEAWCLGTKNIADIGLLSLEAAGLKNKEEGVKTGKTDAGAVRILLEGKFLFDVIDKEEDFSKYKVILLPDAVRIDSELAQKLSAFVEAGGKLLATGESGLNEEGDAFALKLGVKNPRANPYNPDYFRPLFDTPVNGQAAYVFYSQGTRVDLDGGLVLGKREEPYFNRDAFHFCSHKHTPNSEKDGGPGMVEGPDGIYIAWRVFEDYATIGSLALKEAVMYALNRLLGRNKTLETTLGAQGVTTLTYSEKANRYVSHLLYAVPVKRGENVEIIEDLLPVSNTAVRLRLSEKVKGVTLVPEGKPLAFNQEEDGISFTVPEFTCHQMVELKLEN